MTAREIGLQPRWASRGEISDFMRLRRVSAHRGWKPLPQK